MMALSTPIFLSPLSHDLFNNQPGGASAPPFTSPKEDTMEKSELHTICKQQREVINFLLQFTFTIEVDEEIPGVHLLPTSTLHFNSDLENILDLIADLKKEVRDIGTGPYTLTFPRWIGGSLRRDGMVYSSFQDYKVHQLTHQLTELKE